MRRFLFGVFVFLLALGCEKPLKQIKHVKSSTIGLQRKIQMVSCSDGKVFREWKGRFMVEVQNGLASWLDNDGNEIKISGCYVIEEY